MYLSRDYPQLSKNIAATYLAEITANKLKPELQRHFLYRYYLSEHTLASRKIFYDYSVPHTQQEINFFLDYSAGYKKFLAGHSPFIPWPVETGDLKTFGPWFFLYEYLRAHFYGQYLKLDPVPLPAEIQSQLATQLVADERFLYRHPFLAICIIYYAYFQGWGDSRDQLDRQFQRLFAQIPTEPEIQKRYFFGLTHLIICDTNFYQYAPRSRYRWALDNLTSQKAQIQNIDLIFEVMLAGKFFGSKIYSDDFFNQLVSRHYNPRWPCLLEKAGQTPAQNEHSNALVLLLTKKWALAPRPS